MEKIAVLYISNDDRVMAGASHSLFNMIQSVKEYVEPIVLVAEDGQVYDFFTAHGIESIVVPYLQLYYFVTDRNPITRSLRFLKHIYDFEKAENDCVKQVYELLKGRDVKIVHSNSTIMTVGIKIAQRLGAKHIWHVREFLDLDFQVTPFRGRKRLEKQVWKADATIAITHQIDEHWQLDKCKRHYVLWNAVRKQSEKCFVQDKDQSFLFCAARLSDMKGADFALLCFGKSGLANHGYQLKLIGQYTEEYKRKLDDIAKQYSCEEQIIYLGYQKDVKPFMSKASAFMMTSLNEGMGRTTVEAMFFGCPVIARRSGGTVDFMQDKVTGFFFDTEEECINLMERTVENMPGDIITAAQELAVNSFSEEVYGKKILEIYQDVINDK
jgi:glycosyltransferase involved in cell wall biosynthesis